MVTIVYTVVYFACYTLLKKPKFYSSVLDVYSLRILRSVIHCYTMLYDVIQWHIQYRILTGVMIYMMGGDS